MGFLDYSEYLDQLEQQKAGSFMVVIGPSITAGRFYLLSSFSPIAPSAPGVSTSLDNTSQFAFSDLPQPTGSNSLFLCGGKFEAAGLHTVVIADLLNISGGLNASLSNEQTTNLPTAPLTRYSSGEGVFAALVIFTSVGTTSVTAVVSYTNQNGIPGRISPLSIFGGGPSTDRAAGRSFLLPLASGDTGVRSVQSVTLSGSTTTAGNFGVALFKPLAIIAVSSGSVVDAVSSGGFIGSLSRILPNACVSGFLCPGLGSQQVSGSFFFGEG